MAIQFNCPYCTAPIRVPDSAAGKKGTCPKCATKVIVPVPNQPAPVTKTVVTANAPVAEQVSEPTEPQFPRGEPDQQPDPTDYDFSKIGKKRVKKKVIKKVKKKVVAGGGDGGGIEIKTEEDGAANEKDKKRRVRRRRRQRRTGLPTFIFPLFFGGILIGGLAFFFYKNLELTKLTGKLTAERVDNPQLPRFFFPKATLDLDADSLKRVLDHLRDNVQLIHTDLMKLEIRGTERGLEMTMMPGPATVWYRVKWQGNGNLLDYVKKNRGDWDKPRREDLERTANTFVKEYARVLEEDSTLEDLLTYRDQLGINSMVTGLGYVLEARVSRKPYRCVLEDEDSRLYFLLPPELKSFSIRGRKLPDGSRPFNGEYTIAVGNTVVDESSDDPGQSGPRTPEDDDDPGLSERGLSEEGMKDDNMKMNNE